MGSPWRRIPHDRAIDLGQDYGDTGTAWSNRFPRPNAWGSTDPKICWFIGRAARALIESIDTSTVVGLRDRALIGVMTYVFAGRRLGIASALLFSAIAIADPLNPADVYVVDGDTIIVARQANPRQLIKTADDDDLGLWRGEAPPP